MWELRPLSPPPPIGAPDQVPTSSFPTFRSAAARTPVWVVGAVAALLGAVALTFVFDAPRSWVRAGLVSAGVAARPAHAAPAPATVTVTAPGTPVVPAEQPSAGAAAPAPATLLAGRSPTWWNDRLERLRRTEGASSPRYELTVRRAEANGLIVEDVNGAVRVRSAP